MRHNTSKTNSNLVTEALVAAEADGLNGHGLSRLPSYCAQAASGKVDGHAAPTVLLVANATIRVDVKNCRLFKVSHSLQDNIEEFLDVLLFQA